MEDIWLCIYMGIWELDAVQYMKAICSTILAYVMHLVK